MTKEEIIKYVINSPENTNSNVLKGMLDELNENSNFNIYTVTIINNTSDDVNNIICNYSIDTSSMAIQCNKTYNSPANSTIKITIISIINNNEESFSDALNFISQIPNLNVNLSSNDWACNKYSSMYSIYYNITDLSKFPSDLTVTFTINS